MPTASHLFVARARTIGSNATLVPCRFDGHARSARALACSRVNAPRSSFATADAEHSRRLSSDPHSLTRTQAERHPHPILVSSSHAAPNGPRMSRHSAGGSHSPPPVAEPHQSCRRGRPTDLSAWAPLRQTSVAHRDVAAVARRAVGSWLRAKHALRERPPAFGRLRPAPRPRCGP